MRHVLRSTNRCVVDMDPSEVVAASSAIRRLLSSDTVKKGGMRVHGRLALEDAMLTLGKYCISRQGSFSMLV
jgi:hypothetical protein